MPEQKPDSKPETMMSPSIGNVTVNENAATEKFQRSVDEQVKTWVAQHQSESDQAIAGPTEYEVAFFDEESVGEVSCLVVIHCNGQLWRAWESADDAQTALNRSLEHLVVDDQADESVALDVVQSTSTVH